MLSIRTAALRDVAVLNALIHEMADYERLPAAMTIETLARDGFGPQPLFHALLADWDRQPVGYAFFYYSYSTFRGRGLFLEDLFVRASFRGNKIGDALLAQVASIARARKCFGIMLNVLNWNAPALAFFQRHKVRFLDDWKTACLDGEALQAIAQRD